MSSLGPFPTIASLTLGAKRRFKVTRHPEADTTNSTETNTGGSTSSTSGSTSGRTSGSGSVSYSLFLPHNSLLIMHPPMQELYTHEVPKATSQPNSDSRLISHKLGGRTRMNITFRHLRPEYMLSNPTCKCRGGKRKAILKVSVKGEHAGRYYYCCDGTGEETPCNYFQWATWCVLKSGV